MGEARVDQPVALTVRYFLLQSKDVQWVRFEFENRDANILWEFDLRGCIFLYAPQNSVVKFSHSQKMGGVTHLMKRVNKQRAPHKMGKQQ